MSNCFRSPREENKQSLWLQKENYEAERDFHLFTKSESREKSQKYLTPVKCAAIGREFSFVIYRILGNYVSNEIEHFHIFSHFFIRERSAENSSRNVNPSKNTRAAAITLKLSRNFFRFSSERECKISNFRLNKHTTFESIHMDFTEFSRRKNVLFACDDGKGRQLLMSQALK
jgi:hypothetical protein